MVGSRDSNANPNIVLNTIVAEAFADACDILEKADDFDLAVHDLIRNMRKSIRESYSVEMDTLTSGLQRLRDVDFRTSSLW